MTPFRRGCDRGRTTHGQNGQGAVGGVSGYAVQIARCRGAHVIATVRGDAGEARRPGAAELYDSQATDVIEALRAAHVGGVDAVLDLVSGPDAIRRNAK